ncbi:MAG: electron transporter RnfB [Bacilli bacterium]|nr:electron transporter RnfB [Bacilli bacterium]
MYIVYALIVLGGLGLLLGLLIGLCNKFLFVEQNNYVEEVYELLPKVNCGVCGNPGCMQMAEAIVEKGVSVDLCRPCKMENKAAILEILAKQKEELKK